MKRVAPWLLLFILSATACATQRQPKQKEPPGPPEQAVEIRRTIVAWLECEECRQGELDAVVKLGPKAVPTLIATLGGGPSPARRESLREHLKATYQKMKAHAEKYREAKIPMKEEEYIRTYMDNYIALYQSRSAKALGRIGGKEATQALRDANEAPLRDDVKAVVREAIGTWPTPEKPQRKKRR